MKNLLIYHFVCHIKAFVFDSIVFFVKKIEVFIYTPTAILGWYNSICCFNKNHVILLFVLFFLKCTNEFWHIGMVFIFLGMLYWDLLHPYGYQFVTWNLKDIWKLFTVFLTSFPLNTKFLNVLFYNFILIPGSVWTG